MRSSRFEGTLLPGLVFLGALPQPYFSHQNLIIIFPYKITNGFIYLQLANNTYLKLMLLLALTYLCNSETIAIVKVMFLFGVCYIK